jgi:glycosyltransferase involved in cell wall biosynthesis
MQSGGLRTKGINNQSLSVAPLVTIITVVRNGGETLERTIQSVLNQTYKNIEYIIIDGASTDDTLEIIKKYEDRIAYWISEPDGGVYHAMNKGIDMASGEWINFMNSGDIFCGKNVLEFVFSSERKPFIYSDYFTEYKSKIKKHKASFKNGIILHQSVIYKTSLHKRYGYYLETKPVTIADYIFFLSIPESMVEKIDLSISLNYAIGISTKIKAGIRKIYFDYVLGRISEKRMYYLIVITKCKGFLLRLKRTIFV